MKVLIQPKELVDFVIAEATKLVSDADIITLLDIQLPTTNLDSVLEWAHEKKAVRKLDKFKDKFIAKLKKSITDDLRMYIDTVLAQLSAIKERKSSKILKNPNYIFDKIGIDRLTTAYNTSNIPSFTKSIGNLISNNTKLVISATDISVTDDCVIRNMAGNESLLLDKMNNNYPFWFIDTGYTNFLNGKRKTWHRLTRNHLHHSIPFVAPLDRLSNFESFPCPWREDGHSILIIEPGSFSANTFKINIQQWKYDVESELRNYTDKPIIFREKLSKKVRKNLYQELLNDDYYCVININSNAAIESLWAGIPAITLHKHISNCVTSNKLSHINNLRRPDLASWISMVSYSQFTYDEIVNGTALNIVRKYHV